MKEQLIEFKTAVLAKECNCDLKLFGKGYNYIDKNGNEYWTSVEKGISGKENTTPVIKCTQCLLAKWLREVHGIHISSYPVFSNRWFFNIRRIDINGYHDVTINSDKKPFETYEEALEKGLKQALTLIKKVMKITEQERNEILSKVDNRTTKQRLIDLYNQYYDSGLNRALIPKAEFFETLKLIKE
jgi:hypothetical protein